MPDFQFELNVTRKPKRIAWKKLPKLPKPQKNTPKSSPNRPQTPPKRRKKHPQKRLARVKSTHGKKKGLLVFPTNRPFRSRGQDLNL